jgi:hypothetical protein
VSKVARETFWAMRFLAIVFLGLFLLAGCSTESGPEYDPVELIEYEACLNQIISDYGYNEIDQYLAWCKDLKPTKE